MAPYSRPVLRCVECGCISRAARGWVAYLAADPEDPGDPGAVVVYCPPCGFREFEVQAQVAATYT